MRRSWSCALVALASCIGRQPAQIDTARFAARPEWTPAHYALPLGRLPAVDPAAAISRDDAIEDVAYLDHVLASAWPDADDAIGSMVRERARNAPLSVHTRAALCDELARQMYGTSIHFAIGGRPCLVRPATTNAPPEPLAEVPTGKNYAFRIDGDVAVLAIARFVDPSDPGWDGFAGVLRDLATRDLVALDLQGARGDDPRMGFAVLAALGREGVENLDWRAPAVSDAPYAQVARANLAAHAPSPRTPRSRALWATFGAPGDPAAIARKLSPVTRDPAHRLAMLSVLVGRDCEAACGLVAVVAHLASGAPSALRVDVYGAATLDVGGDEFGLVRLPHSGIEVTFPTATYGPMMGRRALFVVVASSFARQIMAALDLVGKQRAEARAWNAQPLPNCGVLARDHQALRNKLGGCPPTDLLLGHPKPGTGSVMLQISLDEVHARTFLASCPDLTIGTQIYNELYGVTIVGVTAPVATMEQLAAASFVRKLEWSCPVNLH